MMKHVLFSIFFITALSGCSGPATWAEELESNLQCGMSVEDIQALTNKEVQDVKELLSWSPPRGWMTHVIKDYVAQTELRLGIKDNRLYTVQVAWARKRVRLATYQRIILCPEDWARSRDESDYPTMRRLLSEEWGVSF
jgi:hypothetical protein